jgi:hypothetical protein
MTTSLASIVALLKTALLLLALAQSPNVPQSLHEQAIQVANQAIAAATATLSSSNQTSSTGSISVSPSPSPTPISSPTPTPSPAPTPTPTTLTPISSAPIPTSVPTAQVESKLKALGIKNVLEYGAKGDGFTDDSDAFVAALNAPGTVYIPGGKIYRLTKTIKLPYSTTIFSDGTATLKMEGSANIRIIGPYMRISGFVIDAKNQSSTSCAITIDNTVSPGGLDIAADFRISNIQASDTPCFFNEAGSVSYGDIDFADVRISNARGTQFTFTKVNGQLKLANISIAAVSGLSVPLMTMQNGGGAWTSNLSFTGASTNSNNHAISIADTPAVWLPHVSVSGMGGSGVYGRHVDAIYIRDLSVINGSGSCIDISDGYRILGSTFSGSTCSSAGIRQTNVRTSAITSESNSVPNEPATLMATNGLDVFKSLINDEYVSVAAYGAKGDGVTDDSAAFSQAIASGKNVFIPFSIYGYTLKNTLVINRPTKIVAPQAVLIKPSTGTAILITSSGVSISGLRAYAPTGNTNATAFSFSGTSLSDISIQDLYMEAFAHIVDNGNVPLTRLSIQNAYSFAPTDTSFKLYGIQDSVLRHVTVSNTGASKPASFFGVALQQPTNVLVRESTVGGFGEGGPFASTASVASSGGISITGGQNVYLSQFHADTTNGNGVVIRGTNGVFAHELISGYNAFTNILITDGARNVQGINSLVYGRIAPLVIEPTAVGVRVEKDSRATFSNLIFTDLPQTYSSDNTVGLTYVGNRLEAGIPSASPNVPPTPVGLSASCSTDGTKATLSWNSAVGATKYYLRVDDTGNQSTGCSATTISGPNGYCVTPTDYVNDNATIPTTVTVTPGKTYGWWVHSVNDAGVNQVPAIGANFSCTAPPPQSTNVPSNLVATCSADGTHATFSWTSAIGAATYAIRVDDTTTNTCSSPTVTGTGGSCVSPTDYVNDSVSSPLTLSIPGNIALSWWIHAVGSQGLGTPTVGTTFSCVKSN